MQETGKLDVPALESAAVYMHTFSLARTPSPSSGAKGCGSGTTRGEYRLPRRDRGERPRPLPPAVVKTVQEQVATLIHTPTSTTPSPRCSWRSCWCSTPRSTASSSPTAGRRPTSAPSSWPVSGASSTARGPTRSSAPGSLPRPNPGHHRRHGEPALPGALRPHAGRLPARPLQRPAGPARSGHGQDRGRRWSRSWANSGVYPPPVEYLQGVRQLCDEQGLLLILDEIQSGVGARAPSGPTRATAWSRTS